MSQNNNNIEKIKITYHLHKNGVSPEKIPKEVGVNRATIYRWLRGMRRKGYRQFLREYEQAKKGRRQRKTNPVIKEKVYTIRNEYKNCCGQKIQYILKKEYDIEISITTIYRMLGEKYQLTSKWKKREYRGKVLKGTKPREVIQIDTVHLGNIYAFTAIDTYTKEASVILKERLDSEAGKEALEEQIKYFGSIDRMQRDGGSEFKDKCEGIIRKQGIYLRTARPYKKNEQAFIERFNGILRKECVGYRKYKQWELYLLQEQINEYLDYYHNKRPHISLNMLTPKEFAMSHLT